jgi:hypothetical protein
VSGHGPPPAQFAAITNILIKSIPWIPVDEIAEGPRLKFLNAIDEHICLYLPSL